MTKSMETYQGLRTRILEGELKPGTRLRVRELALEFGVSPTPVREALRSLEADGLVTISPNAFVEVASMSVDKIDEIIFLRSHLEALATETAVPELAEAHFAELSRLDGRLAEAAHAGDGAGYAELSKTFYGVIYEASPRRLLVNTIDELWDGRANFAVIYHFAPQRMCEAQRERRELMALLRGGDAAGAASFVLRQRLAAGRALIEYLIVTGA